MRQTQYLQSCRFYDSYNKLQEAFKAISSTCTKGEMICLAYFLQWSRPAESQFFRIKREPQRGAVRAIQRDSDW